MMFALTMFVLGVIAFFVDAIYGSALFRLIQKKSRPADTAAPAVSSAGFIAGRTPQGRIFAALVLTGVITFVIGAFTPHTIPGLAWYSLVEFAMLMFAFTIAAMVHRRFDPAEKAKRALDVLGRLESGEIDPAKVAKDALRSAGEKVRGVVAHAMDASTVVEGTAKPAESPTASATHEASASEAAQAAPEAAEPEPKRERTFDEKLREFQNGR